ncbi:hypothetical protein AB0D83_18830 [Streptomyces decoyicus]|uniref:hypothetical protein n=1 Tax=Streptomyces decoyicus TaxID=249567 RepID=UPI003404AD79
MGHDTGADVDELLTMSRPELDRLFRASHPGEIRRGEGRGTVAPARGAKVCKAEKVFGRDGGGVRNRVTPCGIRAIRAKCYRDKSLLDGGESIDLDSSRTSLVVHWIRDEIRQIGPRLSLGIVCGGRCRILLFSLHFAGPHT